MEKLSYDAVLSQLEEIKSMVSSLAEEVRPMCEGEGDGVDEEMDSEVPEESDVEDSEEPMMNPPKSKNLAIILALKKKMKK